MTWPDAVYAQYTYDAVGKVKTVGLNGATSGIGLLAVFNYDDLGRRIGLTRGNGTSTTYGYDSADRPTALTQDVVGRPSTRPMASPGARPAELLTRTATNTAYNGRPRHRGPRPTPDHGLNRDLGHRHR